jgi:glycosyltransferase involved in cell wall biosynthesis
MEPMVSRQGQVSTASDHSEGRSFKLCLATRFFDLRNGGIGRFSMEMRRGLEKRGCNFAPVSTNHLGSVGYMVYSGVELALELPRRCDVYHCLTPVEAIYAPKASTIVTFHDLIPWLHLNMTQTHYAQGPLKMAKGFVSKHYFHLAAQVAARSRLIACDSEHTKNEVIEYLGVDSSKVSVVRLGISATLEPRPRTDGVFRIGTLSYLDRRKRIDVLITAFLAADVDGELVIGGTGVDHDRLLELARGDRRIKFLGFVPEEKMADFYNSLDLFMFPTRIEGYGLPIVEAFACKKPVVVMRDSIIPDEIKAKCLVVEDMAEWLKNVSTSMAKSGERVDSIEENYRFARLHDWDACVDQYIRLYMRVAQRN